MASLYYEDIEVLDMLDSYPNLAKFDLLQEYTLPFRPSIYALGSKLPPIVLE
jgi:hypothetical protein